MFIFYAVWRLRLTLFSWVSFSSILLLFISLDGVTSLVEAVRQINPTKLIKLLLVVHCASSLSFFFSFQFMVIFRDRNRKLKLDWEGEEERKKEITWRTIGESERDLLTWKVGLLVLGEFLFVYFHHYYHFYTLCCDSVFRDSFCCSRVTSWRSVRFMWMINVQRNIDAARSVAGHVKCYQSKDILGALMTRLHCIEGVFATIRETLSRVLRFLSWLCEWEKSMANWPGKGKDSFRIQLQIKIDDAILLYVFFTNIFRFHSSYNSCKICRVWLLVIFLSVQKKKHY